jgi:hypothetical protein
VADVADQVERALDHADAQVRGLAVWAAGETGWTEPIAARPGLLDDDSSVELYETLAATSTTVAELARRALG